MSCSSATRGRGGCFIQAAAPTRSKLASYRTLQREAERLASEINARHGERTYKPIVLASGITNHMRSSSCSGRLTCA